MEVIVVDRTALPINVIGDMAGTSTGRGEPGSTEFVGLKTRVANCYKLGHTSVFEAARLQFYISGISRSCSHQLVRHRLMSFCQLSQRYTKVDTQNDDWYVTPPGLQEYHPYHASMERLADLYWMLIHKGIKPEDARFVLPEATKTDISVGTNLREFYLFLDLREDKHSQWEIRNLANLMEQKVREIDENWNWLMDLRK